MVNVRGYRISANISREECAKAIKVHPQTYADKENGKRSFNIDEAFILAELLHCPLEAFRH